MKSKFYTLIFSVCFLLSLTIIINVKAQTTIFTQNFDSAAVFSPVLPGGWVSTGGWRVDSSNSSVGYTGASGRNNLVIDNDSLINGTYSITTRNIPTTGYANISVLWGARVSKHFSDSGSTVQSFEFNTDGSTWTPVSYTENTNASGTSGNNNWALDNAGARINIPASANNAANLQFRWVVTIHHDTSGTFRFDDFNVMGTSTNGIKEFKDQNEFKVYVDQDKLLHLAADMSFRIPAGCTLTVSDITGRVCLSERIIENTNLYSLSDFKPGIYLVKIVADDPLFLQKIVVN